MWTNVEDMCPKRGPGLSHYKPDNSARCEFCGCLLRVVNHPLAPVVKRVEPQAPMDYATIDDIPFQERTLKQQYADLGTHPFAVPCVVDHDSLVTAFNGKDLAHCMHCLVPVEPKQVLEGPKGNKDDRGRGEFSHRHKLALDALKWRYQQADFES